MAKAHAMYSSFTTGEITERLEGRVDLAKYKDSCKTLENGIVMPHGGIKRRGGLNWQWIIHCSFNQPDEHCFSRCQ